MNKTKILIIDDEADVCSMVKKNLEHIGKYEVATLTKGAQGLSKAQEYKPDLIILDFRMPDVHGSAVALALQDDPITKDIPIVFLTGTASRDELIANGDEQMCDLILIKPSTTEEIVQAIEKNLGRRTSRGFLERVYSLRSLFGWGRGE